MKYFGYGSNLNLNDLKKWCERNNERIPKMENPNMVKLENYVIGFTRKSITRGGGVADIIRSKSEHCFGVVFDVSEDDFKILDKKEGVKIVGGAYQRISLPNDMISYEVVNKESDFVAPTNEYLNAIIDGAKNFGLPQEWIGKLESFRKKSES
jgi:hypothetical protein